MIRDFKYHGKSHMARVFAQIICDKIEAVTVSSSKTDNRRSGRSSDTDAVKLTFDMLIPVPMFSEKEKKRGYNQATLLAQYTAEGLGIPCRTDILMRVRNTAPMNKLGIKEREENLKGAFRLRYGTEEYIAGKHILLIDDIYTTGATAQQCSIVLKRAGASKITVMSLASGRNQRVLPDITKVHFEDEFKEQKV